MARRSFIKAYNELVTNNLGQPIGINGATDIINGSGVGALAIDSSYCWQHNDDHSQHETSSSALRWHSTAATKLPSNRALEKLQKGKKNTEYGLQVSWLAKSNVRHMSTSFQEGKKKRECTHSVRAPKSSSGKRYYKYLCRESRSQLKPQKSIDDSPEPSQMSPDVATGMLQNVESAPYEVPKFTSQFLEMLHAGEKRDFLVSVTDPIPPSMQRWAVEWNSEPKKTISVSELKEDLMRETGGTLGNDNIKTEDDWISVQNPSGPSSITSPLRKLEQNHQNPIKQEEIGGACVHNVDQAQFISNRQDKYNFTPVELYSFKKLISKEMSNINRERKTRSMHAPEKREYENQEEGSFKPSNVKSLSMAKSEFNQLPGNKVNNQSRQHRGWISHIENSCEHVNDDPLVSCGEKKIRAKTNSETANSFVETNSSFYHWLQQRGFVQQWFQKRKSTHCPNEEPATSDEPKFPWSVSYSLKRSTSGSTLSSTEDRKNRSEDIPVRKSKTEIKLSGNRQNKSYELLPQQKQDRLSMHAVCRDTQPVENSYAKDSPIRKWEVIDETDYVQNIREGDKKQGVWSWTKPAMNKKANKLEVKNKKPSSSEKKSKFANYEHSNEVGNNFDGLFGDNESVQKKKNRRKKSTHNFQKHFKHFRDDSSQNQNEDWSYFEDKRGEPAHFDENSSQIDFDWYKTISSKNRSYKRV